MLVVLLLVVFFVPWPQYVPLRGRMNRRFPNTEPQNVEVNPVPSQLSLSFLHDSDLMIRQSAVLACDLDACALAVRGLVRRRPMNYGIVHAIEPQPHTGDEPG